jgi:uncharacterized membrane protein
MTKLIVRPIFKGLGVLVPIALVVYLTYWLLMGTETIVKGVLTTFLPQGFYVPGFGIAVLLRAALVVGLLMYPWMTRKLIHGPEGSIRNVPFLGTVYSSLHDVMGLFDGGIKDKLGQPVLVKLPQTDFETIGFLMSKDTSRLPSGPRRNDAVVYLQTSCQLGGYYFIVPGDQTRPLDMSVEDGLRWVLTAGVSGFEGT